MCDLLGVEHNQLRKRFGLEFAFPEDLDNARALFAAYQSPGAKPFPFRLRRNDGAAAWVDMMCSPRQARMVRHTELWRLIQLQGASVARTDSVAIETRNPPTKCQSSES